MIEHDLSADLQTSLERLASEIMSDLSIREIGAQLVAGKAEHDDLIEADRMVNERYRCFAAANGFLLLSEEGTPPERIENEALVLVVDPIDGSSLLHRLGPRAGPLLTQAMLVRGRTLVAAAVGDIWNGTVYGVDGRLYRRKITRADKEYLSVSDHLKSVRLPNASIALHAPDRQRQPFVQALFRSGAAYVATIGGSYLALRVVSGEPSDRSLAVALEGIPPQGLWEHIGPVLALFGNAHLSRLDGSPFELDPRLKQSSIVAASAELAHEVAEALRTTFLQQRVPHRVGFIEAQETEVGPVG